MKKLWAKCIEYPIDKHSVNSLMPTITHLETLADWWEKCPIPEKSEFFKKAGEACLLICNVMVPRDDKALFQVVVDHEQKCKTAFDVGLQALLITNQKDPFKILSIYADGFSADALKNICQPFESLCNRQIKKALSTSEEWGAWSAYWKNSTAHNLLGIASVEPLLL